MIHERDGQTDGQTLRDSKDRACIASRGKKPTLVKMPCNLQLRISPRAKIQLAYMLQIYLQARHF